MSIKIQGDGVAARCCAHLLGASITPSSRPRVPVIMLSEPAQNLIRDIFHQDNLFRDLPRIRKRIVAWNREPVELDHSAVVVSEDALLNSLGPQISTETAVNWTIYAAPPLPAGITEFRVGSRTASATRVQMKGSAETCWIESLDDGWLFLLSGWLLSVGDINQSKLIREQIVGFDGPAMQFPASPRMVTPLSGDGWICCGSAAMAFDPLCGDGTAHAVREAVLASAVIGAAEPAALSHYEARLTAGFQRHLAHCRGFYSSGGSEPWWKSQVESIDQGLAWCSGRLKDHGPFQYKLRDWALER